MSMDFNDAESNSGFDLIPVNTVVPMIMTIRPGAHGDGGWETQSKTSDATYLNVEFTVTGGPYKNRKVWQNMMTGGGKTDENGNSKAANITRSTLRGILESARRIKPDDMADDAKAKRVVTGYGDFSGLEFVGKIGIEKGSGEYPDKNKLLAPVPVTSPQYDSAFTAGGASTGVAQSFGQAAAGVVNKVAAASTPSWANQ